MISIVKFRKCFLNHCILLYGDCVIWSPYIDLIVFRIVFSSEDYFWRKSQYILPTSHLHITFLSPLYHLWNFIPKENLLYISPISHLIIPHLFPSYSLEIFFRKKSTSIYGNSHIMMFNISLKLSLVFVKELGRLPWLTMFSITAEKHSSNDK